MHSPIQYKISYILIVFLVFLGFSGIVKGQSLDSQVQDLKTFDYESKTDFTNIENYVKGEVRTLLYQEMSQQIKQIEANYAKQWAEENPLPPMYIDANNNPQYTAKYLEDLKGEMTAQLSSLYPAEVGKYLEGSLLKDMGDSGETRTQIEQMINQVKQEALADVGTIVDNAVNVMSNPNGVVDPVQAMTNSMISQMVNSVGESAKDGLKNFIDEKMIDAFNLDIGTDVGDYVDDKMREAGKMIEEQTDKIKEQLGLDKAANVMDTLQNSDQLYAQIDKLMAQSGMPNPMNMSAQDYFSASGWANKTGLGDLNNVGVDMPTIEIPAPAYAVIQISSGVTHFMRAIKAFYIDPNEIRMGVNCLKTAELAMEKNRAFTVIGGRMGMGSLLAPAMDALDGALKGQLGDIIDKFEKLDLTDLAKSKLGIESLINDLKDLKVKIDQGIKDAMAPAAKVADKIDEVKDKAEEVLNKPKELAEKPKEKVVETVDKATEAVQEQIDEISGSTSEALWADATSSLDPVILYSGEFKTEITDLKVKSVGFDFEFRRIYRNQWERKSSMGYNWTYNYAEKLIIKDDTILYKDDNGQVYGYQKKSDGSFKTPYQLFSTLSKVEDGYELKTVKGVIKNFDSKGYLKSITDRFGNKMEFVYGASNQLKLIRDTQGREYHLVYNSGKLAILKDPFEREVRYAYNAAGDLESVRSPVTRKFPEGKITRYNYSGGHPEEELNHNLTMIMDPKGQVYLENRYGTEGINKDRVIAQRFGGEKAPEMKVSYELVENSGGMNQVASRTTVTDRLGVKHVYEHNKAGLRITGEGYTYKYNRNGQVEEKTFPGGKVTKYVYNINAANREDQGNLIKREDIGKDGMSTEELYTYGPYGQVSKIVKTPSSAVRPELASAVRPELASAVRPELVEGEQNSRTITYSFDEKGNIISKRVGDEEIKYSYNEKGQLVTQEKYGLKKEYTYEGSNVVEVVEKAGEDKSRAIKISYDEMGYIKSIKDALGNETQYWTNELGQIIQKRNALGVTTYYSYDANDNMTSISIDNEGGLNREKIGYRLTQKYSYDVYDNLSKKRVSVDRDNWLEEQYQYDAEERVTEIIKPNGVKKCFEYNDKGWVTAEKLNGEVQTKREYNKDGQIISETDAFGNKREWVRDGLGRVTEYKDAKGTKIFVEHTGLGEIAGYRVTEPLPENMRNFAVSTRTLVQKRFAYDEQGRLIREGLRDLSKGLHTWVETERVFSNGRLSELKDSEGLIKKFEYDAFGRFAGIEDSVGNRVQYIYNDRGDLVKQTISNGENRVEEEFAYDALGRKVTKKNAEGEVGKWTYDSVGNVVTYTDALGNETSYIYDGIGNVLQEKSGARIRTWKHDPKTGQLLTFTDGDGEETKYTYGADGRIKTVLNPDSTTLEYSYDILGRPVKKVASYSAIASSNPAVIARNNVTRQSPAGKTVYEYSYDPNGNLISKKAGGYEQRFDYDGLGRLIGTFDNNDPDVVEDDVNVRLAYNSLNELVEEVVNDKSVKYVYNSRGHNTRVMYPSGEVVERAVDPAGFLKEITMNEETMAAFEYALLGLESSEKLGNGTIRNLEYNNQMRLTRESITSTPMDEADSPLPLGERDRVRGRNARKSEVYDYKYIYDKMGRVAVAEDLREKKWTAYDYDPLGRLNKVAKFTGTSSVIASGAQHRTVQGGAKQSPDYFAKLWNLSKDKNEYKMNLEGDWLTTPTQLSEGKSITPSPLGGEGRPASAKATAGKGEGDSVVKVAPGHRYEIFAGKKTEYDERGNLTNDGKNNYKYDPWNRLISVIPSPLVALPAGRQREGRPASAKATAGKGEGDLVTIKYTYDATNRRITKTKLAHPDPAKGEESSLAGHPDPEPVEGEGSPVTYIYSRFNVIAEYTGSKLTAQYIQGASIDEPVALIKDGQKYFYHRNRLGSIVAVSDSTGTVKERYEYDPFGNVTILNEESEAIESSNIGNPITYTGQRYDADTGLYYYKNRYYSPKLGRFLTKDPLGMIDGPNLYAYVVNDPINYIDPMGTEKDYGAFSNMYDENMCSYSALQCTEVSPNYSPVDPYGDYPMSSMEPWEIEPEREDIYVYVEEPDPNSPSKLGRKGMSGHSGIAVGDEFYDYGPQPGEGTNITGSKGRPWWDADATKDKDANRMEIDDYISDHNKTVSVFNKEVEKNKADKVKKYWDDLYKDPGTYHFAGRQCTSTVAESLNDAGVGEFDALKPSTLADQLREDGWKEEVLK